MEKTPIENQQLRNWIKENDKSVIEQWIEENSKGYAKKSNEGGEHLPKHKLFLEYAESDFKEGCKELLTYLGLQDQPEPKKWVEIITDAANLKTLGMVKQFGELFIEKQKLQAENKMLKEALKQYQDDELISGETVGH